MAELRRAAVVRIYETARELCILKTDGTLARLSGDSAELARALLDHLCEPRTLDEVYRHVSRLTGEDATGSAVVAQAIEALRAAGAITEHDPRAHDGLAEGPRVVVGLSGGIAAAHAPALAELLLARGYRVRFAATESALRFVSRLALSALTHRPVVASVFPEDEAEPAPHIALARWADVVVVYPATATTLARIAGGDCSTAVSALAITARVPVLLVPAMNEAMLRAPSVRRNLALLREDGFVITHCSLGYEVAQPPSERRPTLGGAPPLQAVADVLDAVVHDARGGFG